MTQEVLFEKKAGIFHPTALAGGPWHPGMLHGGAPAGLLAYGLEQSVADPELQPARLSIDLIRPVPRHPLTLSTRRIRSGKRIVLEEATLSAEDKILAIATGLFVRPEPIAVPEIAPCHPGLTPRPEQLEQVSFRDVLFGKSEHTPPGLHTTVALRPISQLTESGQGRAWLSLPVPIVGGEANSPFMLSALMADFCNGVGQLRVAPSIGMINADIHLQLFRAADGEWIGVDARTFVQPSGLAMVTAFLHDHKGLIGQVTQTAMPMPEYRNAS